VIEKKLQLAIGRHCSLKSPEYFLGAVQETISYGANALMIYLGAPQNSFRQPLNVLKIPEFKRKLEEKDLDINNVIVHGSYLINLANTSNRSVFDYSIKLLREEIERMEEIGLNFIIIHPGSTLKADPEKACLQVAKGLNLVLKRNSKVFIVLETMSGKGSEIGFNFSQLKLIIDNVNFKQKVGVC
jgi:deoxyribonuclease IV